MTTTTKSGATISKYSGADLLRTFIQEKKRRTTHTNILISLHMKMEIINLLSFIKMFTRNNIYKRNILNECFDKRENSEYRLLRTLNVSPKHSHNFFYKI